MNLTPEQILAANNESNRIDFATGGHARSFAVKGPGDGRSDEIPAKLSNGEYVMDAETVALLGNGSSKAGAQKLDQMRVNIRKAKGLAFVVDENNVQDIKELLQWKR